MTDARRLNGSLRRIFGQTWSTTHQVTILVGKGVISVHLEVPCSPTILTAVNTTTAHLCAEIGHDLRMFIIVLLLRVVTGTITKVARLMTSTADLQLAMHTIYVSSSVSSFLTRNLARVLLCVF